MNRKRVLISIIAVALIIGAFALVTVTTKPVSGNNGETKTESTVSTKGDAASTAAKKEAAEKLIEKTVSRKKIKSNVGKWDKFEMNSNGCERGVYAGKFYYDEFTIFSRTYDKGKTFRIMSVN